MKKLLVIFTIFILLVTTIFLVKYNKKNFLKRRKNLNFCFLDATESLNPELCSNDKGCLNMINEIKKDCGKGKLDEKFFCLSFIKNKRKYCDCIERESYRLNCIAFIEKNPEICYYIDDPYFKGMCLKDIAIELNDFEICQNITNIDWKSVCFAYLKKNKRFCNDIKDEVAKIQCFENINEIT